MLGLKGTVCNVITEDRELFLKRLLSHGGLLLIYKINFAHLYLGIVTVTENFC
jgi:hypothetical protein